MDARKARLILTPTVLLALCGLLAFGAWWGYKQVTAPLHPPTPCVETTVKELKTSQVVVRVFNGGFKTGLGSSVQQELVSVGFTVPTAANTKERVKKTIIVAAKADAPEALLVKGFFTDSTIRVESGRIDGRVDVLVGSEYGGFVKDAPKSVTVSGTACIAVKPPAPTTTGKPSASTPPAPSATTTP